MNATTLNPSADLASQLPSTFSRNQYLPDFDVVENENEFTLYGDLPGVSKENLEIKYENELLVIAAATSNRHRDVRFLHHEYGVGDYHRSFRVGDAIDADRISAELSQGELVIRLPKLAATKPKRIEVQTR